MTPKQVQKYWRTWSAICIAQGWNSLSSAEKDVRRKLTHVKCGLVMPDGSARSMTSFQNRDFSRWLASTAHLINQVDIRDRDRENTVWRILEDAKVANLSDEYLQAISRDLFGTILWRELPSDQLTQFRNVIHNRAGTHTQSDTRTSAPKRKYVLQGATTKLSPHVARSAGPVKHTAQPKVVNGELMSGNGMAADCSGPAGNPAGGQSSAAPSYCMHNVPPPSRRPVAQSPVLQTTIEPDPF